MRVRPDDKQRRRNGPLLFWWRIALLGCALFWAVAIYLAVHLLN